MKMEESILAFYTGRTRSASALLSEQSKNMAGVEKRMLMREMVNLAHEMKVLLESDDLDAVGELLDKNWKLKCQMAAGITDPQIDQWYKKGISAGAKGGKLLGAGNGGFMIFFASIEKHPDIIKAMDGLREIPFSFDTNGSQIIFYQDNTSRLVI